MGANIKQSIVALLIILALSVCFLSVQQATGQTDQATSKLQAANDAVNRAFNEVLDAEKAGANVTDLLAQINVAESNLAQAENSYRTAKQTAIVSSQNAF